MKLSLDEQYKFFGENTYVSLLKILCNRIFYNLVLLTKTMGKREIIKLNQTRKLAEQNVPYSIFRTSPSVLVESNSASANACVKSVIRIAWEQHIP